VRASGWRAPHPAVCFALAATVYLAIALFVFAPALRAPRSLLPYLAPPDESSETGRQLVELDHDDEVMVASVVARNASTLVSKPWRLFGDAHCYPMPQGYTLGEHMFGLGVLAALPWVFSHDPILSFNIALVFTLWLPALTMYALSRHFTRNASAAFVAGLMFELATRRLTDPTHPFAHGDLYAPLALLCLHQLFARGWWRDAVGLAVFTTLTLGESIYPLAALAILALVYVPYVLVLHRRRLWQVLPKLVTCAAWILAAAWLVLGPYLHTRVTWDLLGGRPPILLALSDYRPGRYEFPGFAVLALALIGLLDRLRGPRAVEREDPRLAYFVSGVLMVAVTIDSWWIPVVNVSFASPVLLARQLLPGLDAIRALQAIAIGAGLPLAFVAGYGALALIERLPPSRALVVPVIVSALQLASAFAPPLALPSFGVSSLAPSTFAARPPEEDIALVRKVTEGALLDLPFSADGALRLRMAEDMLRSSYKPGPTAACYDSFVSPVQTQIEDLAAALPDRGAAEALNALGFRTALLEQADLLPADRVRYDAIRRQPRDARRMEEIGSTSQLKAYRLSSPVSVRQDFAVLAPESDAAPAAQVRPIGGNVDFVVRNTSDETFRHPDPIEPSDLIVRWTDRSGAVKLEHRTRALLPIAIGAGSAGKLGLYLFPTPAPGDYSVAVARADDPDAPLGTRRVVVLPPRAGSSSSPPEAPASDAPVSAVTPEHGPS
jgi:hypothetical protein